MWYGAGANRTIADHSPEEGQTERIIGRCATTPHHLSRD
jgi:hypothetical protein